jgi:NTE family protein
MPASDFPNIRQSCYDQTALVLQGGGALGAYQAGVYQALSEAGCEPDWVCGISIGAINAAIIAGNEPKDRLPRLKAFWEQTTSAFPWPAPEWSNTARRFFNTISAEASVAAGQPGFFRPRLPSAAWLAQGSPAALSAYDTAPLRETLRELVDFDRINAGKTRLSLGAVSVRLGNVIYFDGADRTITADHVMASGALPPGFSAICIDGEFYWDGGLVSNTPLVHVLETGPKQDTLVFQVDLFSARGTLPSDLIEVEERRKHIAFSSRTRLNTDHFRRMHALRRAIAKLFEHLPTEARQDEKVQRLRDLGADHAVSIVHLIYRRRNYESLAIDYEFSRASMEEHWRAGFEDGMRTLEHPLWLEPPGEDGVHVYDLAQADPD